MNTILKQTKYLHYIIVQMPAISETISRMSAGEMVVASQENDAFAPALWKVFLYFLFQLTPVISLLIILGAVSTGVNMIAGIVARCVNAIERNIPGTEAKKQGHMFRMAVATILFVAVAWGIAQFGLMAVVQKGYAYLGYAALITVFIPFVIHGIMTGMKEI